MKSTLTAVLLLFSLIGMAHTPASAVPPIKVACVGDSITAGVGASRGEKNYPSLLANLLGPQYQVRNFGESGSTLLKHGDSPFWQRHGYGTSAAFAPDVVVIMLGANDSKPQNWSHKDEFAADYAALLDYYAGLPTHPKLYVCLPTPVPHDNYGISEAVVKEELPLIRQVAAQKGATIIDVHGEMPDNSADFADGVHPNDTGYTFLADAVYDGLTQTPVILPMGDGKFYPSVTVSIMPPTPDAQVRYTTDGSAPTLASHLYKGPFLVKTALTVRTQAFRAGASIGQINTVAFTPLIPLPAQTPANSTPGLTYSYFEGTFQNLSGLTGQTPTATGTVPDFSLTPRKRDLNFGFRYDGYVDVPATGLYTFGTVSDDGSSLVIDGQTIINSPGPHGATTATGQIVLAAGKHQITVLYYQGSGDYSLRVTWAGPGVPVIWSGPGIPSQDIPDAALSHTPSP